MTRFVLHSSCRFGEEVIDYVLIIVSWLEMTELQWLSPKMKTKGMSCFHANMHLSFLLLGWVDFSCCPRSCLYLYTLYGTVSSVIKLLTSVVWALPLMIWSAQLDCKYISFSVFSLVAVVLVLLLQLQGNKGPLSPDRRWMCTLATVSITIIIEDLILCTM